MMEHGTRPTDELLDRINNDSNNGNKKRKLNDGEGDVGKGDDTIELECKEGDILLLNTRLWWHSTVIPVQGVPSISYARDVYFDSNDVHGEEDSANLSKQQSMTNIDGTYAAEDIEAETILFTEHTMPDCELHRSKTNPNCQVVELEDESGESYMAVVSLRYIKAGEFFCVMESDSEGDDDDDSEGEWDEDDVCKPCPT
jgi:U3 small nucleolar RNA-associated protein 6